MKISLEELQEVLDKIEDTVNQWTANSSSFLSAQQELPMTKTSSPSIKLLLQQTMELDLKKTIIYLDYANMDKDEKAYQTRANPMRTHSLNPILSHIKVLIQKSNPSNTRGYELLELLLRNEIIAQIFTAYLTDRYPNPHGMSLLYGEGYVAESTSVLESRRECQLARMIVSMLHTITNTITGQSPNIKVGNYSYQYNINNGILSVSDNTNTLFLTSYYGVLHSLSIGNSKVYSQVIENISANNSVGVTVHDTLASLAKTDRLLGRLRDIEEYRIPEESVYLNNESVCKAVYGNLVKELNRFQELLSTDYLESEYSDYINEYLAYLEYYIRKTAPIVNHAVSEGYRKALGEDLVLSRLRNSELTENIKLACKRLSSFTDSKIKRRHFFSVPELNDNGFISRFGNSNKTRVSKSSALNKLNKIKEKARRGTIRHS